MSTRGCAGSSVIAISAAVGNFSSPRWYAWKIVAVRPVSVSQSLSAVSRGASVKPPAAAPQSTPQDGTSSAPVVQFAGAVVAGAVVGLTVTGAEVGPEVGPEVGAEVRGDVGADVGEEGAAVLGRV